MGSGNQCLTLDTDGFLKNAPCSPPDFTPEQMWVLEGGIDQSSVAITVSAPPVASTTTSASVASATTTNSPETFVLPPPGPDGPGTC